ncbi:MAG: hypothetical protein M9900_10065 [Flavobacteriales bacterium]|nr:hypothetical protein [Flavobacteriales bacterium]
MTGSIKGQKHHDTCTRSKPSVLDTTTQHFHQMIGHYNRNTKLDFGMYQGYELGVVYVFDPWYIDWCINNINKFYISDLNELKEFSVLGEHKDLTMVRMVGEPSANPYIDVFGSFQELIDEVILGDVKHIFSDSTIQKNESKSYLSSNGSINDDFDSNHEPYHRHFEGISDWDEEMYGSSYYKYGGGPTGDLSDDFIDDVLGGNPSAYWNID